MTPGAMRVGSPIGSGHPITPLPPWIGQKSPTSPEDLKISGTCPALSTRTPSTWRPSADNSRNWDFMKRTTRARARMITRKTEMTKLIQVSNSLRVWLALSSLASRLHLVSAKELALRDIMASQPATPKYLNWSEYPIQIFRKDQWTRVSNACHYPLVLGPTIAGMTVTKV